MIRLFLIKKLLDIRLCLSPIFHQLEDFILTNSSKDTDALELMGTFCKKGYWKGDHGKKLCRHYYTE